MRHHYSMLLTLALILLLHPMHDAYAKKKKPKGIQVAAAELVVVTLANGKDITCRKTPKGKIQYGKTKTNKQGNTFFLRDKKDKKKLQKAKKKKKKKNIAIQKAKAVIATKKSACSSAFSNNGGGSTPDPVPADPLAAFSGTLTIDHLNTLVERAAFGRGSAVAEAVVSAGLTSGLDAAIASLTTRRAESSTFMALVQDWADGEINEAPGEDRKTDQDTDPDIDEQPSYPGMENGLYYYAYGTSNPFFYKIAMDLLLPQFTINNDWFDVQPGVNGGQDPWEQWYYYERLLFEDSDTADIKKMANDLLNRRLFIEQYDNTSNTASGTHTKYATALLRHILPAHTTSAGKPIYTHGDAVELAKGLTGWMTLLLDDEILPVFSAPNHIGGNKGLFSGTEDTCTINRLKDYIDNCAFAGKGVSRFYARRILEYYLTPDPPAELVKALAKEIRDANYKLVPSIKKLFRSAVFYNAAYQNRVPKNPIELMMNFHSVLNIPLRTGEDAGNYEGIRRYTERTGYNISRMPPGGYRYEMWASMQHAIVMRNLRERALEDVENSDVDSNGDPTRFYGDMGFTITEYLPGGQEVLSDELLDNAIAVMGLPLSDFSTDARLALKYYILHRRLNDDMGDQFFPYDNVNETENQAKGLGIFSVLGGTTPFMFK